MHIILIANYIPGQQQSMLRFATLLQTGFTDAGHFVEVWRPRRLVSYLAGNVLSGYGKWLAYVDKWLLFPVVLRWHRLFRNNVHYHICDHSNAPYLGHLPPQRCSITCHDVLAIRGAFGHTDSFCPASRFGIFLQRWILSHLRNAQILAADSRLTLKQLKELAHGPTKSAKWRVIPIALNDVFCAMPVAPANKLLVVAGVDPSTPFLLHVGSSQPRKNRALLLKMVDILGTRWSGQICLAGQPMDAGLRADAERLGLLDRIVEVVSPDHETLVALYSRCSALVFPSYSEGFGWPVIEAQACGAPVLASNLEPMPEVSGRAAIHIGPDDVRGFAEALLRLQDADTRASLVQAGFENARRFAPEQMIHSYLELIGRN